jgi:hypothetical protein
MLLEYHDSKAAARHQLPRRSAAGWVCRSGNSTLLAEGIESAPDGCSRTAVSYASSRLRVESAVCTYFLLTFCMWTNCTTGATCCTMTAAAAPPPGPRPNMHTTHAEGTLASRWNPRVLCRWPIAKSYAAQLHTGPMARPRLDDWPLRPWARGRRQFQSVCAKSLSALQIVSGHDMYLSWRLVWALPWRAVHC